MQTDPISVLYRMTHAFNVHDVAAMVANVADDIEWFSVAGNAVEREASGKDAFRQAMEAYFEALPEARSEIESAVVAGDFVSVRERAFWGSNQSQVALGVFEIRAGKIARVWYYPAYR